MIPSEEIGCVVSGAGIGVALLGLLRKNLYDSTFCEDSSAHSWLLIAEMINLCAVTSGGSLLRLTSLKAACDDSLEMVFARALFWAEMVNSPDWLLHPVGSAPGQVKTMLLASMLEDLMG